MKKSLNIGINITSAVAGGGITYLKNLINQLSVLDKINQYYIFSTESVIKKIEPFVHLETKSNFNWSVSKTPSISPISRVFWEQFILPLILKKNGIDILFSPANIAPVLSSTPFVLMVRNMAVFDDGFINNEKIYQRLRLKFLQMLTVISIKRAKKVIFISKNARDTVCSRYDFDKTKTALIYHGRNEDFGLISDSSIIDKIKNRYNLTKYFLYVSNIYRYKNFSELISAFVNIKDKIDYDIELVFAGVSFDDLYFRELKKLIKENNCTKQIHFIGHVPNEQLSALYGNAELFIYPSTIENCPNILIEAMGCGAPVIASNIEPMPEICQDGAIYFNPNNSEDIADKMLRVLHSNDVRLELSKKAVKRAKYFSWDKTAIETLKILKEATC